MLTSEYTTPLEGSPYYRNVGIIKAFDRHNRMYNIGEIIYERFDDQNFQYIIKPYWDFIEHLPKGLFQGIPGIDMNFRRKAYYRVNITPTFISMRTPSESRENVRELMESVGLDYYDRFEWLLRSETLCGDDNLFVVRKIIEKIENYNVNDENNRFLDPNDTVEIDSFSDIQTTNNKIVENIYGLLQSGAQIYIRSEERFLSSNERRTMLYLLKNMLENIDRNNKNRRQEGILQAKTSGSYVGRKPIEIEEQLLKRTAIAFFNKLISEHEAMKRLNLNSRATFYRKIKEYRNSF